jgi:hypothetical protein
VEQWQNWRKFSQFVVRGLTHGHRSLSSSVKADDPVIAGLPLWDGASSNIR